MNSKTASHTALDRSDERVRHDEGLFGALRAQITRIKTGDLGTAPVIAGLIVISLVFTFLNPVYIAPNNLVNLLFDCATVGFISLGIVCVLMLGEIDLSVGSMSGLASAIVGVLWVNAGWPLAGAIAVALACGVAVGLVYALLYTRVGMPSFVATLAGLLALLGMQLYILGPSGSINLPYTSPLVRFGQLLVMPGWFSHLMALLPGLAILIFGLKKTLAAPGGQSLRRGSQLASGARDRADDYLRGRGALPQSGARYSMDFRSLCRLRDDPQLRAETDKMGSLDVRGWRQP
ncbi:sugar ABC transport system permease component [Klebsiella pneumoniae]|nr:sugar ABC transport system permease component [Klebsiella pneumoniae]